jgi:hypothetical protein
MFPDPRDNKRKKKPALPPGPPSSAPDGPHPHLQATPWNNPITNPYGVQSQSAVDKWRGKPVTPDMPQQVVDTRAAGARWNAGFANNGWSTAWADTPTGQRNIHPSDRLNKLVQPQALGNQAAAQAPIQFAVNPGAPESPTGPALTPAQVSAGALRQPSTADPAPAAAPAASAPAPAPAPQNNLTPYGGRIIDGVPTFSDGTGNVPRTMSNEQIASAAQDLPHAPAPVLPLASDILGHTPTSQEIATRRAQGAWPGAAPAGAASPQILNPMAQQQRNAQSDAAAVASGDWRSPLGTAASNLRVEANSGTPRNRRMAEKQLYGLTNAVNRGNQGAARNATTLAATGMQQRGATRRTGMTERGANRRTAMQQAGANRRTQAQINNPTRQVTTLGNGQLAIVNPRTGAVEPARGPNGQAVQMPRKTNTSALTARSKYLREMTKNLLALDANGQIADPNAPGGFRAPTAADWAEKQGEAQLLYARATGTAPPMAAWLVQARAQNPGATDQELAALYQRTYGKG